MALHYHGTPITPTDVLLRLAGRCFCVSYSDPRQVRLCHEMGQSVMLDNGAFSFWRAGKATDWPGFYRWADEWLDFPSTWAVIPDVIEGTDEENDRLVSEWPFGDRGAPVWHMHEPVDRLLRLADTFARVCFGSSGQYATVASPAWHERAELAFDALSARHRRVPWIHMLRGMALAGGPYPFASFDSTNVARNHAGNYTRNTAAKDARAMVDAIDARQCPGRWLHATPERQLSLLESRA
jgi:hypothetical protein